MATNPLRGKYVSRSVYQRAVEKNKRLLNDIRILAGDDSVERRITKKHYQAKFRREANYYAELEKLLKEEFLRSLTILNTDNPFDDNSNHPINSDLN
jgi:hypothetical protein